jgi:hypothetical protein
MLAMADEVETRLRAAAVVTHPGELGTAREQILAEFIRSIVPLGFEVSRGFVIDSLGRQSRQQDIVIIRRDYHPIFRVGDVNFFPVEAVAATVELKSTLDKKGLTDALGNVRSVKALDRTGDGHNYIVAGTAGGHRAGPVNPDAHNHQVLSLIVAVTTTMSPETAADIIWSANESQPRRLWHNGLFVADRWALIYYLHQDGMVPVDQMASDRFGIVFHPSNDRASNWSRPPLAELANSLWSYLRVTPLIDVSPCRYLPLRGVDDQMMIDPGAPDPPDEPPLPADG